VSELLRQRSRVTNLALLLILSLLGLSLVGNFRGFVDAQHGGQHISWGRELEGEEEGTGRRAGTVGGRERLLLLPPKVISDTVNIAEDMSRLSHLVVVAG